MTDSERDLLVQRIANELAIGVSKIRIKEWMSKDPYNLKSDATHRKYFKLAAELMQADLNSIEEIREINNSRLDLLYDKSLAADKVNTALKAVDLSNKTNGIYTDKKVVKIELPDKYKVVWDEED